MYWIDWLLVAVPLMFVCLIAVFTRRYIRGVSDFLSAGRLAGRYLVANAEGTANFGAISIIALFEMLYKAGTTVGWWQSIKPPIWILIAGTGYIIYRFRETRAMTMAQFLEMRYSRSFRIFMGALAWVSGLMNFGLFPVITAKFFVIFLSLPLVLHPNNSLTLPTYVPIMMLLIGANLFFVTLGGQLTAMVVDCVEGLISGVMLLGLMVAVFYVFSWRQMATAMTSMPEGHSLINPFDAFKTHDFNLTYVVLGLFTNIYGYMAWQGNSGFNSSALNPHEAKMGKVLGQWRTFARNLSLTLLVFGALAYMNHPSFLSGAASVHAEVAAVSQQLPATQSIVPIAIRNYLPYGMRGMFAAIMLFAAMACDTSYMHSWGSIFVQDVMLPIRQSWNLPPLSPQQHLRWLRRSIIAVGLFAFAFGILWTQDDYILMFQAVTGAIFLGGAGCSIVGGLYWKRGTTAAAWSATIVGSTLTLAGIIAQQVIPNFPLNGQFICAIAMVCAAVVYIVVSLATSVRPHDMDKLLHRGRYAVDPVTGDPLPPVKLPDRTWRGILGIDDSSTRADKLQCSIMFSWSAFWLAAFVIVTTWNLIRPWPTSWWVNWTLWTSVIITFVICIATTIWFTWGGLRDLRLLFRRLETLTVNELDDGRVSDAPDADHETPSGRPIEEPAGLSDNLSDSLAIPIKAAEGLENV
jgi:solute:Na+ symporter, SSS family